MSQAPAAALGPYQLERCIGADGLGEVWLARLQGWPEPVVVKRLHPSLATDGRADRFLDEMLGLRQLRHPNLGRLLDGGHIGSTYYLVTEFVDGLTLRQCLDANRAPLPPAVVVEVVTRACAGLGYAHEATSVDGKPLRLVHRDVSPDNIMVDRSGVVRVLDLGIAGAAYSLAATRFDHRRGKRRYAAPEFLERGTADPCIDVYSLGATLYDLCAGAPPPAEQTQRGCRDLPPLDEARPGASRDLLRLVADATRLQPEKRIPSMAEFGRRLEEVRRHQPSVSAATLGMTVAWWADRLDPEPDHGGETVAEPLPAPAQRSPSSGAGLDDDDDVATVQVSGWCPPGSSSPTRSDTDQPAPAPAHGVQRPRRQ